MTGLASELKKAAEYEGDSDSNSSWCPLERSSKAWKRDRENWGSEKESIKCRP